MNMNHGLYMYIPIYIYLKLFNGKVTELLINTFKQHQIKTAINISFRRCPPRYTLRAVSNKISLFPQKKLVFEKRKFFLMEKVFLFNFPFKFFYI